MTLNSDLGRVLLSPFFQHQLRTVKYLPPSPIEVSDPLEMICILLTKIQKLWV